MRLSCPECGVLFTRLQRQTFCSRLCANHANVNCEVRACPECGTSFVPRARNQRYCSRLCSGRASKRVWLAENKEKAREYRRAYRVANPEKALKASRKYQVANREKLRAWHRAWKAANPEKARESERAWRAANQEKLRERQRAYHAAHPEKRREAGLRRRAVTAQALSEAFDIREIFDRDAWCCGICGERVDSNLTHPNPKSASLDHIIPLSQGGDHTRANVQLAHLKCNLCKSDRILPAGEQLRLVG